MESKYYWIKLKNTFMTSETVDFLMGQKDGANYVVLYQMLCLKTANTNGELGRVIGEILIPYDEEKITRDCKWFSIDTVRIALTLYKKLGLIYQQDNGLLKITDMENLVGSETKWANYKRIAREKDKIGNRPINVQQDIDIRDKILENRDKNKDIEKEILKKESVRETTHTPLKNFIVPSLEDIKEYCEERNNLVDFNRFYDFYQSKGWMVGKNKMKDWKAAIRTWEKEAGFKNVPSAEVNHEDVEESYEDALKELKEMRKNGGK